MGVLHSVCLGLALASVNAGCSVLFSNEDDNAGTGTDAAGQGDGDGGAARQDATVGPDASPCTAPLSFEGAIPPSEWNLYAGTDDFCESASGGSCGKALRCVALGNGLGSSGYGEAYLFRGIPQGTRSVEITGTLNLQKLELGSGTGILLIGGADKRIALVINNNGSVELYHNVSLLQQLDAEALVPFLWNTFTFSYDLDTNQASASINDSAPATIDLPTDVMEPLSQLRFGVPVAFGNTGDAAEFWYDEMTVTFGP